MEELEAEVEEALKWCRRHRREGVVGKAYGETPQIMFKAKVDLPKRPKIVKEGAPRITLPPMPEDTILRALQHAYDEVTKDIESENDLVWQLKATERWKDKRIVMPIVAKHVSTEAREHNYTPPRNLYDIYLNTPTEKIVKCL